MAIQIPRLINWFVSSETVRQSTLARPALPSATMANDVAQIISDVASGGDVAVGKLNERIDGVTLSDFEVTEAEWTAADSLVEAETLAAISEAIGRIHKFHAAGMPVGNVIETAPGLECEARYLPISPVGLYIPGGSAPLISTVIMLGIPAQIAGCQNTVLCTPPNKDGEINPAILAAASRCGISRVFKIGGAQAIAAMGMGTETVPACAKLFGPGNSWVTEAKQQVSAMPGGPARDMPAGPSEVLVIADDSADAESVCWDLLSQAEHGPDSQSVIISDSAVLLEKVRQMLPSMAESLQRKDILAESLQHLRPILAESLTQAMEISNSYAPEHLILNCQEAETLADAVIAAGSVFIGPWTPESLGDYCSGTNHVLPTYGYARSYSGLSVNDFLRRMTLQRSSLTGLQNAGPCAVTLATAEGLDAHAMAVTYRLQNAEAKT